MTFSRRARSLSGTSPHRPPAAAAAVCAGCARPCRPRKIKPESQHGDREHSGAEILDEEGDDHDEHQHESAALGLFPRQGPHHQADRQHGHRENARGRFVRESDNSITAMIMNVTNMRLAPSAELELKSVELAPRFVAIAPTTPTA